MSSWIQTKIIWNNFNNFLRQDLLNLSQYKTILIPYDFKNGRISKSEWDTINFEKILETSIFWGGYCLK